MGAEAKKPAGWKSALGTFWLRTGEQRCKQCLRISPQGAEPIQAHERSCDEYPRAVAVRGPDLPARLPSTEEAARMLGYAEGEEFEGVQMAAPRRVDKPRPRLRDRGYLTFVRDHDCCLCHAAGPSDPHHWSATIRRGVGQKLDDLLTVPLCRRCHDVYHARNALPGMTKAETEMHLLGVQVELLVNWIAERKLAEALDSVGDEI